MAVFKNITVDINLNGFAKADAQIRKQVAAALNETGYKITADAKRLAPVDTGRLRSSIHPEFAGAKQFSYTAAGATWDGSLGVPLRELEAVVGSNVEYAAAQEFGLTGSRRGKGIIASKRNPAHLRRKERPVSKPGRKQAPYLRPAYHKNRNYLKTRIASRLKAL